MSIKNKVQYKLTLCLSTVQKASEAHPVGNWGSFPGGKAAGD